MGSFSVQVFNKLHHHKETTIEHGEAQQAVLHLLAVFEDYFSSFSPFNLSKIFYVNINIKVV